MHNLVFYTNLSPNKKKTIIENKLYSHDTLITNITDSFKFI